MKQSMGVGLLCAVLGAIGFSFKAILVKLAYRHGVDAETLLALRMAFALPFFLAMAAYAYVGAKRGQQVAPTARDAAALAGLGFLGYYLSSYFDFLGLNYISAGLERLILFTYPTIVIVLSALFLKKPITPRMGLALLMCYLGIGLAVGHDLAVSGGSTEIATGSALVFASAISYALFMMGNGAMVARLGAMQVTALATAVACLLSIAQFLLLRPLSALVQPWEVYSLALQMAVVSTVAPVWLISEAMRHLGAGPVSLTGTLGPVATLGLGWWLLGEHIGTVQLIGAVLVIGGVLVMARRRSGPSPKAA